MRDEASEVYKEKFNMSNADFLRESGISATSLGSKSIDRSVLMAATNDRLAKLEKMYNEITVLE